MPPLPRSREDSEILDELALALTHRRQMRQVAAVFIIGVIATALLIPFMDEGVFVLGMQLIAGGSGAGGAVIVGVWARRSTRAAASIAGQLELDRPGSILELDLPKPVTKLTARILQSAA